MTYSEAADVIGRIRECAKTDCEMRCSDCKLFASAVERFFAYTLAMEALHRLAEMEDDGK